MEECSELFHRKMSATYSGSIRQWIYSHCSIAVRVNGASPGSIRVSQKPPQPRYRFYPASLSDSSTGFSAMTIFSHGSLGSPGRVSSLPRRAGEPPGLNHLLQSNWPSANDQIKRRPPRIGISSTAISYNGALLANNDFTNPKFECEQKAVFEAHSVSGLSADLFGLPTRSSRLEAPLSEDRRSRCRLRRTRQKQFSSRANPHKSSVVTTPKALS